ncbi:hypothetical protein GCM10023351_12450 [Microbacterium gilvum]|uniref:Uncharacterized protein n=1 Tax=Microbacterium gilvum TaxID=1336204 RepID=A0ABP9A016_9MICO
MTRLTLASLSASAAPLSPSGYPFAESTPDEAESGVRCSNGCPLGEEKLGEEKLGEEKLGEEKQGERNRTEVGARWI